MEGVVGGVLGQGAAEVEAVAVEINVVFVAAAQPGEAMGVEGMDQQHPAAGRQGAVEFIQQNAHLATGSGQALHAVGAGDQQQQGLGRGGAQGRRIDGERLTGRAAVIGQDMAGEPGAGANGGGQERLTGRAVIGTEEVAGGHGGGWWGRGRSTGASVLGVTTVTMASRSDQRHSPSPNVLRSA